MDFKTLLFKEIEKTLKKKLNFSIEFPPQKNFGDFSSNLAFILAKEKKEPPQKIAQKILKKLENSK
ncbi:arginine--tRNA ligase, partial [bacterium]|nr:arginine--tRNA ligase [bacterium]